MGGLYWWHLSIDIWVIWVFNGVWPFSWLCKVVWTQTFGPERFPNDAGMEDKMTTKSPAKQDAPLEPMPYNPIADDWDTLTEGADEVLGHDLAKDAILDALVGVPFMITRVTFQESDKGHRENYVTCECVIAPRDQLERRRVNLSTLPFDPGDHVVFNDGSTGIYRQIVAYLYGKGFISLPDPVVNAGHSPTWNKDRGAMEYECSFDLPPSQWADVNAGEMRYTPSGTGFYQANVRILAKRGIRLSEYDSEEYGEAKTRYLA